MSQYDGIALVQADEKVSDSRWQQFSDEELQALLDGFYNYESGEVSNETVKRLIRGILTESKVRAADKE